jgi:hypothetical protein
MANLTILTKPKWFDRIRSFAPDAALATMLGDLTGGGTLISFCTNVIVPNRFLPAAGPEARIEQGRFQAAYNVHPGDLRHPGRDPHHWAIYEGAEFFGVCLHEMAPKVDEGEIIRHKPFRIDGRAPQELRTAADNLALDLLGEIAVSVREGALPTPTLAEQWIGKKRSRADLIAMCDFRGIEHIERKRREFAFQGFERHFIV